ncbi:aminoacyl-tRNA deacylase [Candidatus Latescibacterota bacterium]
MPVKKLKDFLDSNNVKYVAIKHSTAYTAQDVAASTHVPGREMAKTVMVKVDGKMTMAVLPASNKVDFGLLKKAIGTKNIELADEKEFKDMFPECDVGAMPPFGNLYGIDVYVSQNLAVDEEIAFNAGSHTEIIKLAFEDYKRLENFKILEF